MTLRGDEPDDAELTDGDSTGNGWSNVGGQFLYAQIGPIVYARRFLQQASNQFSGVFLCFSFDTNWFNHPGTWAGSPFKG